MFGRSIQYHPTLHLFMLTCIFVSLIFTTLSVKADCWHTNRLSKIYCRPTSFILSFRHYECHFKNCGPRPSYRRVTCLLSFTRRSLRTYAQDRKLHDLKSISIVDSYRSTVNYYFETGDCILSPWYPKVIFIINFTTLTHSKDFVQNMSLVFKLNTLVQHCTTQSPTSTCIFVLLFFVTSSSLVFSLFFFTKHTTMFF